MSVLSCREVTKRFRRRSVLEGAGLTLKAGESAEPAAGDAAVAPADSRLAVANTTDRPARMWVTTRTGLTAELPDGTTLAPPWAR
ncbi:hypothetical protein ACIGW0_14345 [Streptomyces bikiniensis]|uniref:Uncharacterized protein n=1 Tax=Streptomyces bikiniensis TaxID=1896 RepID=A0ABW8CSL0_STRBI